MVVIIEEVVLKWQLEDELIIQSDRVGRGIPGTGRRAGKGRVVQGHGELDVRRCM